MVKMVQITMGTGRLVDHKGELDITLRLIINYTLRDIAYLGEHLPGGQPTTELHLDPICPTFLESQQHDNYFPEVENNFEEYASEYATLSAGFRRHVTLDQYCGIKYMGRPRSYHRGSNELERREKMEIPTFDGSARTTA
jgi:hypothetical protein